MERPVDVCCRADRDSDVIRLLRFPLALMVVFLHAEPAIDGWEITRMSAEHMPSNIVGTVMMAISHVLTQIAVPAFFLISGFLFFRKLERWSTAEWKRKMESRVKTIVIPYVLWITLFCVIHVVRHMSSVAQSGGITGWISEWGGVNLYWSASHWVAGVTNIWGQKMLMSGPFPFHLWFLRDLIVAFLLSPLFYVLFRRRGDGGKYGKLAPTAIGVLSVLYFTQLQLPVPGFSIASWFYFGLGAFMSLNELSLSRTFCRYRYAVGLIALGMLLLLVPLDGSRTRLGTLLFPFWVFSGVVTIVNLAYAYVQKGRSRKFFLKYEDTSFFLYMIHPFYLGLVWAILSGAAARWFGVESIASVSFVDAHPIVALMLFFAKVAIAACISMLTFRILARLSPRLTKIFCGR